ncbi:MAG: response regulator [Armatimonadetes bacterium]|nr:response regulator [Anaerolineae bacterium]
MLALIVEDDASLRVIYRRVLEDLGFKVLEAADGIAALNILETAAPDVIFLDMLLPTINGVTVLNHIVTEPSLRQTHTVIVSSNKQFERMERPDMGITFMLKPIRPAQIKEIAAAIAQRM